MAVLEDVSLKHRLTDAEMASLARQQANAIEEKKVAEGDLAAIKKDYGGRIALKDAEIGSISARVNAGWEMRNVRCLLVDERPDGYRLVIRTDTATIEKKRKLETHERQVKLFVEGDNPPQLAGVVLLGVDDPNWDTEYAEVPLYQDEIDILRQSKPDLSVRPITGPMRQLQSANPADDQKKAKDAKARKGRK